MRIRVTFIFAGLIFLVCTCSDEGQLFKKHFVKYYGLDGDHEAADLIVNADGSMVIMGTAEFPSNSGNTRVYIVKTNQSGKVIWETSFGNGTDLAQDIEPISSGYVVLSNFSVGVDQNRFMLTRIDEDGVKIDSLVYDALADQTGHSVTPLSDGGFYVVGNTLDSDSVTTGDANLPVPERHDLLYVRFDNTFQKANSIEDRVPSSTIGSAVKVFETSPGVFVTSEYSNKLDAGEDVGDADAYEPNFVFREFTFDASSSSSNILVVGDPVNHESMSQSITTTSGNVYSIGTSVGLSNNVFITKTRMESTEFVELFRNSIGTGNLEGVSIFPSTVFCYVLANSVNAADGTRDIWLTKINSVTGDQDPAWVNGFTFGSPTNDDTGKVVAEAPNGDIVILGTMTLTNQKKLTIIKLNNEGKYGE